MTATEQRLRMLAAVLVVAILAAGVAALAAVMTGPTVDGNVGRGQTTECFTVGFTSNPNTGRTATEVVASGPMPAAFIGETVTVTITPENNPNSIHSGTHVVVESGGGSVTAFDVETTEAPGSTVGTLTGGDSYTVTHVVNVVSSLNATVQFCVTVAPPPTEPPPTEPPVTEPPVTEPPSTDPPPSTVPPPTSPPTTITTRTLPPTA